MSPRTRPPLPRRLIAASCYLGLAPLAGWLRRCRADGFVRHHSTQALALFLVGVATAFLGLAVSVGWAWVIIHHREVYEAVHGGLDGVLAGGVLLVLAAAWAFGLGTAVAGSTRPLPLVTRLAARRGCLRTAAAAHLAAYAGIALVIGLVAHAAALCREEGPADVYVLYDDMGVAPRWLFRLGAYRIARAARQRWGPGSTAVAPLDASHLADALRRGRVLILLCHGREGMILKEDLSVLPPPCREPGQSPAPPFVYVQEGEPRPDRWQTVPVGGNLRLAYITACDGGLYADRWRQALAPAEVVTFDRLSAMLEHAGWLWLAGPAYIRQLPEDPPPP
jgi:hypothetical protein